MRVLQERRLVRSINREMCAVTIGGRTAFVTRKRTTGDSMLFEVHKFDAVAAKSLFKNIKVNAMEPGTISNLEDFIAWENTNFSSSCARPSKAVYDKDNRRWLPPAVKHEHQPLWDWWVEHEDRYTARALVMKPEPRYFAEGPRFGEINQVRLLLDAIIQTKATSARYGSHR